jgi:hypothetical protein
VQTEIENFVEALGGSNGKRSEAASKHLLSAAGAASPEERSEAVRTLASILPSTQDPAGLSLLALTCGALVENGADPAPLEGPLLDRFVPALRNLAAAIEAEPPPPAPHIENPLPPTRPVATGKRPGLFRTLWMLFVSTRKFKKAMKEAARQEALRPKSPDELIVTALSAPVIAMFCASPDLRAAHPEVAELANAAHADFLHSVFSIVVNEPFVILEPSTRQGILARVSGVDINFTLNMLIMHSFPGPDGAPRSRLSTKAAGVLDGSDQCVNEMVLGSWNLYNWQALSPDGALPVGQSNTEHWIWNEGKPTDIALFEGRRVVLLGPPAYCRSWPAQRTFAAARPQLIVEQALAVHEVDGWLERILASRRS